MWAQLRFNKEFLRYVCGFNKGLRKTSLEMYVGSTKV